MKVKFRRWRPRLRLPGNISVGTRSVSWSPSRMFGVSVVRTPRRRRRR
jgi:hypothetical protein